MISVAVDSRPVRPRETERNLASLLEVAQVLNSSLELSEVLERILTQARSILDAESGSVMLIDDSTGQLRVLAAQGPRAQSIQGRRRRLGEGVAGWVARQGKPLRLHGPTTDPRFKRVCQRQDVRDALCVPLRVDGEIIGVVSVSNRVTQDEFSDADLELLAALSHHAAVAIRNARSFEEVSRQRRTVERLLQEVTRAQEEERKRIALLLHDGPAQTLFAALRNLETVNAVTPEKPEVGTAMRELEHTIRCAIDETRSAMIDLRPPCLDDIGLYAALRQYAKQFEQRTRIPTSVARRGLNQRAPLVVESCFYRIAQEALTNVWKHAEARSARVCLEVADRYCLLEIADDGKGFDPQVAAENEGQHLGLGSLRDRAELAGGRLTLASIPGQGTRVCVSVPLAEPETPRPRACGVRTSSMRKGSAL